MAFRIRIRMINRNYKIFGRVILFGILIFGVLVNINLVSAQSASSTPPTTTVLQSTVCCEKTKSGLYCQDVPATECAPNSQQVPTSCSSTSFCKPGYCYDTKEGTCLDHTPRNVCNANNGTFSPTKPAQCELGCCILGDQAAFVTLVRCKRLSSFLGLQTNYNKQITDETQCVLSVQNDQKGACVYDFEFERTCKFTTRGECSLGVNGTSVKGTFYQDKLCSDDELGTNCGPSEKTTCVPGKDEVYFVDTCGNPANIYDASKVNDKPYWANVVTKDNSCNSKASNGDNKNCGNCNYLLGSYCRPATVTGTNPTYGGAICADLNCKTTTDGKSHKHGESWCEFTDSGTTGKGVASVGSRFYKHLCINGEEILEPCAEFRQEECIQSSVQTSLGAFSFAACRVNRWQDCVAQDNQQDCENSDKRDCYWKSGIAFPVTNATSKDKKVGGACLPKNPPGLQFWQGTDAQSICAQANAQCIVTFTKGLLDSKEKCTSNCQCLTPDWAKQRVEMCQSLGDCGPVVNWLGDKGFKSGYNITTR